MMTEFQDLLVTVTEENRLLRDFAYNVDPSAIVLHQHRMALESEDPACLTRNLNNPSTNASTQQTGHYLMQTQSVLTSKIGEFINKYAKRRRSASSSTPQGGNRRDSTQQIYLYEDDKALLGSIKTEAQYVEGQLSRFKRNEDKLISLMSLAYQKLESVGDLAKNDPDLKLLNRQMREVLSQRDEMITPRDSSL